jgi:hypothetical protein
MDIYFTEIETGARLTLSMLPEKAKRKGDTQFQTYDIINVGEVKIPKGTNLLTFSWSGTLPGISRRNASFVKSQYWHSRRKSRHMGKVEKKRNQATAHGDETPSTTMYTWTVTRPRQRRERRL